MFYKSKVVYLSVGKTPHGALSGNSQLPAPQRGAVGLCLIFHPDVHDLRAIAKVN